MAEAHWVGKIEGGIHTKCEIRDVRVVNGLPAGLTENAIAVARQITFTPATKNGSPVSVRMMLVYSFDLSERVIHRQNIRHCSTTKVVMIT